MSDIVIAGYAETPIVHRSGRTPYDLAGEVYAQLLHQTGLSSRDIDGLGVSAAISEAGNNFFAHYVCDALGLSPRWLQALTSGGASMATGVARAASALRDGQCQAVVVLAADTPSTLSRQRYGAYRDEFQDPTGVDTPVAMFGLLTHRYAHQYGLDPAALAKIAVTQRQYGLLNPLGSEKFKRPLTREDYDRSRVVAEPLRLLDCVMYCDGANAVLVTTAEHATRLGLHRQVRVSAYGEITLPGAHAPAPDVTQTGFHDIAPRLFSQAGMRPADINMLQLYDDFTIAVLLQLEALGFCPPGGGSAFIAANDFGLHGNLPLNTGGGQLSAGQPGLAGGGVMLIEAVRQLMGDGGERQVARARNALVTGLGVIPYSQPWATSAALILEN